MRILVTGNMGYVGPVLIRHLRERFPTAELIGFDTGFFAHTLTGTGPLPEVLLDRQIFGDVRALPAELLAGVDAVVQLAAISNDPMGDSFAAVTDAVNHRAAVRLATLAREAGVRQMVFASSCSVYGFAEAGARREHDPVNPLTAYARSKIAAEEGLRSVGGEMVVTCLRFATACGASDRLRLDLVLNDFVAAALASGEIRVLSDGSPWRPLIDVADMARAIEWAITRTPAAGGRVLAVNVGSARWNYQVRDLAAAVAAEIEGVRVAINTEAPPDKRSYQVDFSLFEELAPDHQPRLSLAQSIQRIRALLAGMGFEDRDFRRSRLMRLRVLEDLMRSGRLTADLRWDRPADASGQEWAA